MKRFLLTLLAIISLPAAPLRVRAEEPNTDPREAYLECRDAESGKQTDCYQKALARSLANEGIVDETRRDAYLTAHPHADAEKGVADLYALLFPGFEPRVEKSAKRRWQRCRLGMDRQDPSERYNKEWTAAQAPYTPGDRFLAREILECLNTDIYGDLDAIREEMSGKKFSIRSEPAINLIRDLFLPKLLASLQIEYDLEKTEEVAELARRKPIVVKAILDALLANPAWAETISPDEFYEKCEPRAKLGFSEYQRKVRLSKKIPTRVHEPAVIREEWAKEACTQARDSMLGWKLSLTALEEFIAEGTLKEADECRKRMGIASQRTRTGCPRGPGFLLCRSRLQGCIREAWDKVALESMGKWKDLEFARKNPFLKTAVERYLEKHKERIQRTFWEREIEESSEGN